MASASESVAKSASQKANRAAAKANGKSAPSSDDLAAQVGQIKEELGAMAKMMSDYGWSKEKSLESAVRDGVETAKVKANDVYGTARDQAQLAGDQAQEFVRKQPATALGIAAGIGFLIGMMSNRR